jgi:hypothetical protein
VKIGHPGIETLTQVKASVHYVGGTSRAAFYIYFGKLGFIKVKEGTEM